MKTKTSHVGMDIVSAKQAYNWNFSEVEVMIQNFDLKWNLGKSQHYEINNPLAFEIPIEFNGDCFDRYLVFKIKQSEIFII